MTEVAIHTGSSLFLGQRCIPRESSDCLGAANESMPCSRYLMNRPRDMASRPIGQKAQYTTQPPWCAGFWISSRIPLYLTSTTRLFVMLWVSLVKTARLVFRVTHTLAAFWHRRQIVQFDRGAYSCISGVDPAVASAASTTTALSSWSTQLVCTPCSRHSNGCL